MSQHDLVIDNASGSSVRADINNALAALGSTMKGNGAPASPLAGMQWVEDDNPSGTVWTWKVYDGADWISLGQIDATNNRFTPSGIFASGTAALPGLAPAGDPDTGIWSPSGNTLAISTNGAEFARISTDTLYIAQNSTTTPGAGNTTQGTTLGNNGTAHFSSGSAGASYVALFNRSGDGGLYSFNRNGTQVGYISVTSTTTTYSTSSDYRLKDELEPITSAVALVAATPVYRFRWKATPTAPKVMGFMAHEAQAVVPEAVTGPKDGPQMQGIDQSKLVPLLWAAVQELAARVATLEAQLAPSA